jgi:periplasmic protein TonB
MQSATVSVCIHIGAVAFFSVLASTAYTTTSRTSLVRLTPAPLYAPPLRRAAARTEAASGGGNHSPLPPALGRVQRVKKVFIPPVLTTVEHPKIVLPSGLEDVPQVALNVPMGVPYGIPGMPSFGPGGNGAGGPGKDGEGRGPGGKDGTTGADLVRGKLTELPKVIFKIEPEYSEEARKARYQGNVLLAFDVDVDGKPHNIRVVQPLGLGLDERAIEAVMQWRFKPGIRNGRPVRSPVSVEVSFRLL